ncbi:MAG: hypothetical protein AAGI66_06955 [Cyanobacteria bacterium P01_H01_bin.74]
MSITALAKGVTAGPTKKFFAQALKSKDPVALGVGLLALWGAKEAGSTAFSIGMGGTSGTDPYATNTTYTGY